MITALALQPLRAIGHPAGSALSNTETRESKTMRAYAEKLKGVYVICPRIIRDDRGFFSETFRQDVLRQIGFDKEFVQDNHSFSRDKGVIRGLHFQIPPFAQDKLVRVIRGAILDVVVDLRKGSPTYGQHIAVELSADNWKQLLVPAGFAHGFCTLEENTEVLYKVTNYYSPRHDKGLAFDDPDLGIQWPVDPAEAILSEKDRRHPRLKDLPTYFTYDGEEE